VILYPNIPKTGSSKFNKAVWPTPVLERVTYETADGGQSKRLKVQVFAMQVRLLVCLTGSKLDSVTIRPRLKWVKVSYKKHFGAPTLGDVGVGAPDGDDQVGAGGVGDDLVQVPVQGGENQPVAQVPQPGREILQNMFDEEIGGAVEEGDEADAPQSIVSWGWSQCRAARNALTPAKVALGLVAAGCCYVAYCAAAGGDGRRLVEFPNDIQGYDEARQLGVSDYIKGFDSTVEFSFTLVKSFTLDIDGGKNPFDKYLGVKYLVPNRNGLTMYANNGLFEAGVQFRQSDEKGQFGVVYFSIMTKLLSIKKWASIRSTTFRDFITNNFDKDTAGRRGYTINAFLWSEWSKFQIDG